MINERKIRGVTLVEILLVLVIISSILIMATTYMTNKIAEQRVEKAILQVQQTLTAALSFYMDYSQWPGCSSGSGCLLDNQPSWSSIPTLIQAGYLPQGTVMLASGHLGIANPWGKSIFYSHALTNTSDPLYNASLSTFLVCMDVPASTSAATTAKVIASRLPMAFVTDQSGECLVTQTPTDCTDVTKDCRVVAQTTVPGQNLNNARSMNFAGVYHNGACVPAPSCPSSTMTPVIFVTPVSVTGNYYGGNSSNPLSVYPLSSFTAYPVGNADGSPRSPTGMPNCLSVISSPGSTSDCVCDSSNNKSCFDPHALYWRVCLDVVTSEGRISTGGTWTKDSGTVMVMTRCEPNSEPSGSKFEVFQSN